MPYENILSIVYCYFVPMIMLIFGIMFICGFPKKINRIFGVRTKMSMSSPEAWRYTHKLYGRLWTVLSVVMLVVTTVYIIIKKGAVEYVSSSVLTLINTAVFMLPIPYANKKLRKNFDDNGRKL